MRHFTKALTAPFMIAGILGLASLGTIASVSEAQAYSCKTYPTQAVGVRKKKFRARTVARNGWQSIVKSSLGVPWSLWSLAQNKSMTCVKINTNQGKKWRCLASARPCLYVVK